MLAEILSIAKQREAPKVDRDVERSDVESPTEAIKKAWAQSAEFDEEFADDPQPSSFGPDGDFPLDWSGNFECLGELVVDKKADATEMMTVYQTLKTAVKSDILYVNPGPKGISIFCVVADGASFMAALPKMPRVAGWVLSYK